MRTIRQTFLALAALAGLAGCAKEQPVSPETGPDGLVTLRAVQEVPGTRALIGGADSKSIFWSEDDALSVFDAESANVKFTLNGGAGTTEGSFTGRLESAPSSYVALHPYQADAAISNAEGAYKISGVTLKSEQSAVAGSFDPAAALMTAQASASDASLQFRNVVGFVKVKPEFNCNKITLVSKSSSDALAGTVELSLDSDGIPGVAAVTDASSRISISGDIKANSTYYIAALPATLADGFRLIFTTAEGDKYRETTKSLEIKRCNVKNLGGFTSDALDDIPFVTFSAEGAQKFTFTLPDDETAAAALGTFEYSVNGGEWIAVTSGEEIAFGGSAGTLRLRGISPKGTAVSEDYYSNISFSNDEVEVSCTGDIRTLIDWENYDSVGTGDARFCGLFEDCSVLTSAPKLPAMVLADYCYAYMFKFCTMLTEAPALPAETLADYCYSEMFYGCTKLTEAPALNAMNLADYCYANMFFGCSVLEDAPALPATTLAEGCYSEMFKRCTVLKTAPVLPAAKLVEFCYDHMFDGCSSLNEVIIKVTDTDMSQQSNIELYALNYWLEGVAAGGTIYKSDTFTNLPTNSSDGIPSGWTVKGLDETPDNTPYVKFTAESQQTFVMTVHSRLGLDGTSSYFEYSIDKGASWKKFYYDVYGVKFGAGTELWLRGKSPKGTAVSIMNSGYYDLYYSRIIFGNSSVPVAGKGDIRTLVDWENYDSVNTGDARFCYLFSDCDELTSAPELPAMTLADNCYASMFSGCVALETAPELPAKVLAERCYLNMFYGCSKLTAAPTLPAPTLVAGCYANMFRDCVALISAPALPAQELAKECYQFMFTGCTELQTAPALSATTLAESCYNYMFQGCTKLTDVPDLKAETLAKDCCVYMFSGCTSLESAPALPAMTLAENCYWYMFSDCTSLTKAPELPAETLAQSCYSDMFSGCSTLNKVVLKATGLADYALTRWLDGAAATGTVYSPLPEATLKSWIPSGWNVKSLSEIPDDTPAGDSGYLTFKVSGTQTFGMTVASGLGLDGTSNYFEYSVDKGANWTRFTESVSGISFSDELWLRGISPKGTALEDVSNYYSKISFGNSGVKVAAGGDIRSLVNYADYKNADTSNARFIGLFMGCEALTSTPDLQSTKLADYCYRWMFMSCASLTKLPDVLPATELAMACYSQMFMNCTSLENVPEGLLPATEFRIVTTSYTAPVTDCYASMFAMCSKLKNAPKLPATILSSQCYMGMFQNCTSLAAAPELNATEMAYGCYYSMFQGCSSLTEAPLLPATALANACYKTMFQNCTSLTKAPELPAETLKEQCYYQMFHGCSKLNEVIIKAKTGGADIQPVNQWLTGVASTGTIHKYQSYTVQSYSGSQIPSGWTIVNHSDSDWNTIAE